MIYTNTLIYAVHDPIFRFIVREYRFNVKVECDMSKDQGTDITIHNGDVKGKNNEHKAIGTGNFPVELKFFTDAQFQHEISSDALSFMVGDKIYVIAQTNIHDFDVKMSLSECFTKPTKAADDIYRHFLIKNGYVLYY